MRYIKIILLKGVSMKKSCLFAVIAAIALHGEIFNLGEIEVTSKIGDKVQESDTSVAVIDEEKMKKRDQASLGSRREHAGNLRR